MDVRFAKVGAICGLPTCPKSWSWAFEFKRHFCFANVQDDTLHVRLVRVVKNARDFDRSEADGPFGALIVGTRYDVEGSENFIRRLDDIMAEMPLMYRIDGCCGSARLTFESVD